MHSGPVAGRKCDGGEGHPTAEAGPGIHSRCIPGGQGPSGDL